MAGKEIKLPEVLDSAAFDALREILADTISYKNELTIDCVVSERLSTPCAQLFTAFLQERMGKKLKTKIINVSENFKAAWRDLGLGEHFVLE